MCSSCSRIRAYRNGALELRQVNQPERARGQPTGQEECTHGCSRRQLNNPAVASAYESKDGWQLLLVRGHGPLALAQPLEERRLCKMLRAYKSIPKCTSWGFY